MSGRNFNRYLAIFILIFFIFQEKLSFILESIARLGLALNELKMDRSKMFLNFGQESQGKMKPPSPNKPEPDTSHNV